jgi:hypothetical protein
MRYLALNTDGAFTLALRARLIQRKSINNFSTGAMWATARLAGVLVALASGCAGGEPGTTPSGDRVLTASPARIKVGPNEIGSARFVLTSGGVPIAGQTVSFTIIDDPDMPGVEAQGATLVDSSAETDVAGVATVGVRAGLETTFTVRAMVGSAHADLTIDVTESDVGSVMVAPFFAPNSNAEARTTSIELRFFDDGRCADFNLAAPPDPHQLDRKGTLPKSGGTKRYDVVRTAGSHAVVGDALDAHGIAVAVGCVDLAGSSLVAGGVVEVGLPLHDAIPDPVGSFAITSTLAFVPPLAATTAIAAAWRDLGDCPLDPAQLFLDCMIDALSPETAADPLDCNPIPGGEGVLGDALAARRGELLGSSNCRGASDGSTPTLDAIAMGLFGTPTPALVVALPAIGEDAVHLLDRFRLSSTLDVQSAGRPDEYVVTHTLLGARFGPPAIAGTAQVDFAQLALPALTAYATATTRDGLLVVDSHGFSLRLGRVARTGFGAAALTPRGVSPADAGGLIAALAALAKSEHGAFSRCAAFDDALCAAVGRAPGCLAAACPAGLSTLAAKLEAAFDAADGTGLDLYLAGWASLLDTHGDGSARQLGSPSDPTAGAQWSVDLRTAAGRSRITAAFEGVRE